MEKRPTVISWVQFLLLSTIFLVPLFSFDYLAYSVIEKTLLFFFLVEVAFSLWLYAVLRNKEYLPHLNSLLIATGVFLALFTISGVIASSPEIAFWSTMSRMTGLILLFHIAAFVLMLISTIREEKTWLKVFGLFTFSGALVTLPMHFFAFSNETTEVVKSTFGNDSYTAAFLTFSFFFALIMIFRSTSQKTKIFFAVCAASIILSPVFVSLQNFLDIFDDPTQLLGTARAASLSIFIALTLSVLSYFATSSQEIFSRVCKSLFAVIFIGLTTLSIMVFIPDSEVQQRLSEEGIGSRLVFWDSAIAGIADRPLLGYGPEHYFVPLYLHFNTALFTKEYAFELHTSKPHSSYLEVLVSGGVLSFIPYMTIWVMLYVYLWRLWKEKILSRINVSLMTGLVSAYLLQSIVLFDTLSSYMGIGVVIAYVVYAFSLKNSTHVYPPLGRRFSWTYASPAFTFCLMIVYFFVWLPLSQQAKLIYAMEEMTVMERSGVYGELFSLSPIMRTSMSEYLMAKALEAVPPMLGSAIATEREIILSDISSLRQTVQTYFETTDAVHYRQVLYLARLQLLEFVLEKEKAKQENLLTGVRSLELTLEKLSPKNPQNYWLKAQRELFEGDVESALLTLQTDDESMGIAQTREFIMQVERYASGEGNVPFFTY